MNLMNIRKDFSKTHNLNLRSHGKQHGEWEDSRMNPTSGHWHASHDAGCKNPTGQRAGSHSSVRKLLIL